MSGAPKPNTKKRRFADDDEGLASKPKLNKKEIQKYSKNVSVLKAKSIKSLEAKSNKLELEVGNKNSKIATEKKSQTKKAIRKEKKTDLTNRQNPRPKLLKKKKKITESVKKVKKSEDEEKSDSSQEAISDKPNEKASSEGESDGKTPISRSGRLRKIRFPSEDFLVGAKEAKNLTSSKPKPLQENGLETNVSNINAKTETTQKSDEKPRAVNPDLLQDILNESVESWFDISAEVQKKGKNTRRKFKIIPQAHDSDSEFAEEVVKPQECLIKQEPEPMKDVESFENVQVKKEDNLKNEANEEENENEESKDKLSSDREEPADTKVSIDISVKIMPKKKPRLKGSKLKSSPVKIRSPKLRKSRILRQNSRQITSFNKKKRMRTTVKLKGLKNYGEKIDFNQKLDSTTEKELIENISKPVTISEGLKDMKIAEVKIPDIRNLPLDSSPFRSISNAEELLKPKTPPLRRSYSFEDVRVSPRSEEKSKSIERSPDSPEKPKVDILSVECSDTPFILKLESLKTRDSDSGNDDTMKELHTPSPKKKCNEESEEASDEKTRKSKRRKKNDEEKFEEKPAPEIKEKVDEPDIKIKQEPTPEETENKPEENTKVSDVETSIVDDEKKEVTSAEKDFSLGSMSKCIPLKKRRMEKAKKQRGGLRNNRRRSKVLQKEQLGENVPPKQENTESEIKKQKDPPDRRKSYREIKLTPKIVDLIATSTKRPKKFSSLDNRTNCLRTTVDGNGDTILTENESGYSNLIKRATITPPKMEIITPEPPQVTNTIENYLQTKMEQNAVNFESSWVPGDLVWARFAGLCFLKIALLD